MLDKTQIREMTKRTMEGLKRNRMLPFYAETKEEALALVEFLLKDGATITTGGSATLQQCGIMDLVRQDRYRYIDRSMDGLTPEEVRKKFVASLAPDVFLCSSNAITESGELYNVDGNSNRVSSLLYGPESVIVVAGYNKIVKNLDEAVERVKRIAAPKNTQRLQCDTYCRENGTCVSLQDEKSQMCDGCHSTERICCNYVVCAQQRHVDRIKVILVGEELGF